MSHLDAEEAGAGKQADVAADVNVGVRTERGVADLADLVGDEDAQVTGCDFDIGTGGAGVLVDGRT